MDKLAYLKRVPIFSGLSNADVRTLQTIAQVHQYPAGKTVFGEDTTGDRFYIVLSGRVKIFASAGARHKTLAYLDAGEFFGEIALLDSQPRSASCTAIEPCELLMIRKNDFRALLLKHPRMCLQVLETLSRRLRLADTEIESLVFEDVLGRVAGVLLDCGAAQARRGGKGTAAQHLTQKEIAEMVGTGREVVSRIINRFKRLGCIRYDDKTLVVADPEKLRQFVR